MAEDLRFICLSYNNDTVQTALRALVEAAGTAAERQDWDLVATCDIDFHRALISACNSTHLSTMFEHLLAELRLAFLLLPDRRALHEPYIIRNDRTEYLDRVSALADIPGLEGVDHRALAARLTAWPWGSVQGPPWLEHLAVDRLLGAAEFATIW